MDQQNEIYSLNLSSTYQIPYNSRDERNKRRTKECEKLLQHYHKESTIVWVEIENKGWVMFEFQYYMPLEKLVNDSGS